MIGSELIRLHTCPDTSNYVAKALEMGEYDLGTVIMADYQSAGRGRRLKTWQSAAGENLTFSFAVDTTFLSFDKIFLLSKAFSLAVAYTLEAFQIPEVTIKWPNDLMAGSSKIAGLLIENKGNTKRICICGIGLNVNQMNFPGLPYATSMARCRNHLFDRMDVLNILTKKLDACYQHLRSGDYDAISRPYYDRLFGSTGPIELTERDYHFDGRIVGVDNDGALRITTEKGFEKRYYLDQVKVKYPH